MKMLGAVLIMIGLILGNVGLGALRDKKNHLEYGVESEKLHSIFSLFYLAVSAILCFSGGWLLAGK